VASQYSGLSTRLLEDLVKDGLVTSSLVRRPGCARGVRLLKLSSLQAFIESGIGVKTDMSALERSSKEGLEDDVQPIPKSLASRAPLAGS
jgi:hypothetical protein